MPDTREDIARRRAARQKKIRKRRLTIALIFLLIMALCVGAVLCVTVLFPITSVTASGSQKYPSTLVVKKSGVNADDNFFTLTQKEVAEKLQKELPYIESVELKRTFPDSIQINVKDAEEYACYNIKGTYWVVSKKGVVLNKYDAVPENTFEIVCEKASCTPGEPIQLEDEKLYDLSILISDSLESNNIKFERIDISDKYNIILFADGRFEVLLGNANNIEKKIAHLSKMISTIAPERSGKINLSMWTNEKSEGSFTENKE